VISIARLLAIIMLSRSSPKQHGHGLTVGFGSCLSKVRSSLTVARRKSVVGTAGDTGSLGSAMVVSRIGAGQSHRLSIHGWEERGTVQPVTFPGR
jgi:hypothetical protein